MMMWVDGSWRGKLINDEVKELLVTMEGIMANNVR